jgi:hypothetical protein
MPDMRSFLLHTLSHIANSHIVNSHIVNSHIVNSHIANSHIVNSHIANSHIVNSHIASDECSFVLGQTPCLRGKGRGEEVAQWLHTNRDMVGSSLLPFDASHSQVSSFVVLDDEHAASFAQCLPEGRVVPTLMSHSEPLLEGLTKEKAAHALAILQRPFQHATWT